MKYKVIFSPEALDDQRQLYAYIARASGSVRAKSYTNGIRAHCLAMDMFPERGTRRDDVRPGLRMTHYLGRTVILFHINASSVVIDSILYGGRDVSALFMDDDAHE